MDLDFSRSDYVVSRERSCAPNQGRSTLPWTHAVGPAVAGMGQKVVGSTVFPMPRQDRNPRGSALVGSFAKEDVINLYSFLWALGSRPGYPVLIVEVLAASANPAYTASRGMLGVSAATIARMRTAWVGSLRSLRKAAVVGVTSVQVKCGRDP